MRIFYFYIYQELVEVLENLKSNFVGRFENYENDIKILSKMHPKLTCLNEINIKKREVDYREHYSKRNRNIIEEVYKNYLMKMPNYMDDCASNLSITCSCFSISSNLNIGISLFLESLICISLNL